MTLVSRLVAGAVRWGGQRLVSAWQNIPYYVYRVRRLTRPRYIVAHGGGQTPAPGRLAIFGGFQRGGSDLLDASLAELRREGFRTVYVSNLPVSAQFLAWLEVRVDWVCVRPNVGRDFGAYSDGYHFLASQGYLALASELLFINDTHFFPLYDASRFWQQLRELSGDVVGPYESFSPRRHVQSFFLLCRNKVWQHSAFRSYWENFEPRNSRRYAIEAGEIGFSQALIRADIATASLVDAQHCLQAFDEHSIQTIADGLSLTRSLDVRIWESADWVSRSIVEQRLFELLQKTNPSHTLAVFSPLCLHVPLLKKDVVYRGSLSLGDVVKLHRSVNATLSLQSIMHQLRKKRVWSELSLKERIFGWLGAT